jgi:hypothetical protein
MKVKLNLSGEGIKQFFLVNGEKIVLGGVVIALLGFLYSAITAKPLDETKSPDVVKRESAVLMNRISDPNSVPPAGEHPKLPDPPPPIPQNSIKWPTEISPLIFPELKKRSDPTILPIEELQIASGVAIVGFAPQLASGAPGSVGGVLPTPMAGNEHGPAYAGVGGPAAAAKGAAAGQTEDQRFNPQGMTGAAKPGDEPRVKTYAIITGLVPWSKQCEEYSNRFEFAVPPSLPPSDPTQPTPVSSLQTGQPQLPEYIYFLVQRTEALQPKGDADWPQTNYYGAALKDIAAWSNQSGVQEIVDPNYVFQPATVKMKGQDFTTYITWPLPPLFLKIWGFEATHPKVKLNVPQDVLIPGAQPGPDLAQPDFDGVQGGARAAAAPAAGPAVGAFGPVGAGREHGYNPSGGRFGGGAFIGQPAPAAPVGTDAVVVDNKLFRFIDSTAEPGKTYRYRIKLVVNNPNYGLLPDCLDANVSKAATLYSDWAVTGPVTIPRDYRLLADSVSIAGRSEPKAKLTVLAIVKAKPATEGVSTPLTGDVPLEALKELSGPTEVIPMGGIVDLHDLAFGDIVDVPEGGLKRKVEKVSIDTDQTTLLDLRNDDPLGTNPRSKGPTEMLLMDSSGRLIAADSAADSLVVADYKERTKLPPDQNMLNVQPAPQPTPTQRQGPTPKQDKGPKGPK